MSGLGVMGAPQQASGTGSGVSSYGTTIEGQPFRVCSPAETCTAPPVRTWGGEPVGSPYRAAWDTTAKRLGTANPMRIIAEIERQIAAAAPPVFAAAPPPPATKATPTTNPTTTPTAAPTATPAKAKEGIGSFVDGMVKGDFSENDSWSKTGGQIAGGFIPIYGQIADARDTAAAIGDVWNGREGGWVNLGAAVVGWVPGFGDAAKSAIKGGRKLADAGSEVTEQLAKRGDDVAEAVTRERIVLEGGTIGSWNRVLNQPLKANADYLVNGYLYKTDALGRVASVEGKLDLEVAARNGYQQAKAGGVDRLPDDQGGHLIASIFNGPGERLNLVPMNGNFNMGAWRSMEARLADAAAAGKNVEVKIEVIYGATGGRPEAFRVEYIIDGQKSVRNLENRPGG